MNTRSVSRLAHYTALAAGMDIGTLIYSLADVVATLKLYRDADPVTHPYAAKLWAEFDAYTVEIQKRRKPLKGG